MNKEQFSALLGLGDASPDKEGWAKLAEERMMTLHVARNGVSLTVSQVCEVKEQGELVIARTSKGDQFLLNLEDIFAGSVGAPRERSRQAGFR